MQTPKVRCRHHTGVNSGENMAHEPVANVNHFSHFQREWGRGGGGVGRRTEQK